MKLLVGLLALLAAGCGHTEGVNSPDVVSSSGADNEVLILSETARFSGQLSVRVTGQLTDYRYDVQGSLAAGWYVGDYGKNARGTAYYYQPYVLEMGSAGWETVTNVSGHEVCHAAAGARHDHKHWECMTKVASPTYPDPGDGEASSAYLLGGGCWRDVELNKEK